MTSLPASLHRSRGRLCPLDAEFLKHMQALEVVYAPLPSHLRVRVERWATKLSHEAAGSSRSKAHVPKEWGRNRNLYSALLLQMVQQRKLVAPFHRAPPCGPLPMLPPYMRASLRGPPKYNKKPWRAIETRLLDRASRQGGGNTPTCGAVAVVPAAEGAPSDEDLLESQLQALRDRTSAHHAGQPTTGTGDTKIAIDRDPGLDMQVEEDPDASGATPTTGAGEATRVNVPTLNELSAARPATQLGAAQERLQRKVAGLEMLVTAERRQIEGLKHSLAAEADRRRDEAQHLRQLYARQLQALRHRQVQEMASLAQSATRLDDSIAGMDALSPATTRPKATAVVSPPDAGSMLSSLQSRQFLASPPPGTASRGFASPNASTYRRGGVGGLVAHPPPMPPPGASTLGVVDMEGGDPGQRPDGGLMSNSPLGTLPPPVHRSWDESGDLLLQPFMGDVSHR